MKTNASMGVTDRTGKESAKDELRGPGRPRDAEARKRILDAALGLLETVGFSAATTDLIAERAGVSKATLYRWWPNKAGILIEAFRAKVSPELPFPDTGSLADDLRTQVHQFCRVLNGRRGKMLAAFVAAASDDVEVAAAFKEIWVQPRRADAKRSLMRYRDRGALPPEADLDVVLDLIYGPLYYRMLVTRAPLSARFADALVDFALSGLDSRHK